MSLMEKTEFPFFWIPYFPVLPTFPDLSKHFFPESYILYAEKSNDVNIWRQNTAAFYKNMIRIHPTTKRETTEKI